MTKKEWKNFLREESLPLDVCSVREIEEIATLRGVPCTIRVSREWSEMEEGEVFLFHFNEAYVGFQPCHVSVSGLL